jgi:hypothetical protein
MNKGSEKAELIIFLDRSDEWHFFPGVSFAILSKIVREKWKKCKSRGKFLDFLTIPREIEKSAIQIDSVIDVFSITGFKIVPQRQHGKSILSGYP